MGAILAIEKQNPLTASAGGGLKGESGADLLSQEVNSLSLARSRFTVLFEMGRGGSKTLWAPDKTGVLESIKHEEESNNWIVITAFVASELLLKIIGSSLTGN